MKTPKRGRGRPPVLSDEGERLRPHKIKCFDPQWEWLETAGDGDRSAKIRALVDREMERGVRRKVKP